MMDTITVNPGLEGTAAADALFVSPTATIVNWTVSVVVDGGQTSSPTGVSRRLQLLRERAADRIISMPFREDDAEESAELHEDTLAFQEPQSRTSVWRDGD